jgi:hypothetical protein
MKKSGTSLRSTTARTRSSAATSAAKPASSPKSGRVSRLMGGLSMVAVATPPSTSTRSRW